MGWHQVPHPVIFPETRHYSMLPTSFFGEKETGTLGHKNRTKSQVPANFLTCMCADMPLQVKGVVEALAAEGAQVPLHLVVALEVPVEHTL